jgi:hypothetical protein
MRRASHDARAPCIRYGVRVYGNGRRANIFSAFVNMWRAIRRARAYRRVYRLTTGVAMRTLAEARDGELVRAAGVTHAIADRVLIAPLSQRPCLYYCVSVDEVSDGALRELAAAQDGVTFSLVEDRAVAVIDPTDATISATFDHGSESAAYFDADAAQRGVLERLGLVKRDWFRTDRLRYREAIIAIDQLVEVVGTARSDPNGAPPRLTFSATPRSPLVITELARRSPA